MGQPLILLDRDGVLNAMVVDVDHGTIDSPLHPDQVTLLPGVADALARLSAAGYRLAIVTNQPAAAKGKTTRKNLEAVHETVLRQACASGGRISTSHICFHRSEDGCVCRKPRTGLLEDAMKQNDSELSSAWMVGDGVTDVQAGAALGLRTAFLGPRKCDACKVLRQAELTPTWWGRDLPGFTDHLLNDTRLEGEAPAEPVFNDTRLEGEAPAEPVLNDTRLEGEAPAEPVLNDTRLEGEAPAEPVLNDTRLEGEAPAEPVLNDTRLEGEAPAEPVRHRGSAGASPSIASYPYTTGETICS